ncbi:MAG TPA: hypothetical protein VFK44_06355 [Bacillales bacterium]|nr:hypothetical protein [Bacillales bacterium]
MKHQDTEKQRLPEFAEFHEDFLAKWDHAMKTGDAAKLEAKMVDEYKVYFFTKAEEAPSVFEIGEIKQGMRASVSGLSGGRKTFTNKVIRMCGDDEAVVFYEQIIEKDGEEKARLFTIESWKASGSDWILLREIVQPVG